MTVIDRIEVELAGNMVPLRQALDEAERATAAGATRLSRAADGGDRAFAALGDAAGGAAKTIQTALVAALSGAQLDWDRIIGQMALRLSDLVLQASVTEPLGELLGGGTAGTGGGGTGDLAGSLAGLATSLFAGFRAAGGPVEPGRAYLVGEQGPELFLPGRAGTVQPGFGRGSPPAVIVNVTTPDADSFRRGRGAVAAALGRALAAGSRFS